MQKLVATALLMMAQLAYSSGPQAASPGMTPPGRYSILSRSGKIQIPFEMFRNKIRMPASINGRDCHMTIDNGFLWDELLFFGSPKTDSLALRYSGEVVIGDANAANSIRADRASDVSVDFKDIVFTGQAAVVTRYDRNRPNLWEGIDGQVSATFFKHFVVKIDFDKSIIELIRPEEYNPPEDGQTLAMNPGPNGSRTIKAIVKTQNGLETPIDLLVDIGGIYPLYLPVGKYDSIELPKGAVESVLGRGLNQQNGFVGRVQSVRLGRYALSDIVTAFTRVAKDAEISGNTMIGLPLLRRFNVTFDYPHERIVLEPSNSFSEPFKAP